MSISRGTTLLETLISVALFSILVVAVFMFYDMGKMKWNVMYLRHNLQLEARRAMVDMERDLRKTNYSSVDVYTNPRVAPPGWGTTQVPRWAICMVGLNNWGDPKNFDLATGKPLWNRYIIYMATQETNQGGVGPMGGAGSGRFFQIVVQFKASGTNGCGGGACASFPIPLHFPAFVSTRDWLNNNEFGQIKSTKLYAAGLVAQVTTTTTTTTTTTATTTTTTTTTTTITTITMPTPSTTYQSNMDSNMPPQSGSAPAPDKINTDASSQFSIQQMQQDTQTVVCATSPPYCVDYVNVKYLANVFAFKVTKDDPNHAIQVSYKTRGVVTRPGETGGGYESRQIDFQINPQAYRSLRLAVGKVQYHAFAR